MNASPTVSVIMATYNRSNILPYTLSSLLRSTYQDWELLVIGDACTDDTESVVASFADPRIRFFNLSTNCGEQSGPNNEGYRLSKGNYIAYLNHDDLWYPDHLETAVRGLNETGADLVYTLQQVVYPDGIKLLSCGNVSGRYEPSITVPASCWLLRRELMESVGLWPSYRECYNAPSQEWLMRAWKSGADLRLIPHLTVIAIPSGMRKGSYSERQYRENQYYYERMVSEPNFREKELISIALQYANPPRIRLRQRLARVFRDLVYGLGERLGIAPSATRNVLFYRRKGEFVNRLREIRGLPKLD